MPKCYDCGTKLPWITNKQVYFALENGKKVGKICESCYLRRMEEAKNKMRNEKLKVTNPEAFRQRVKE